jgi:PAS domain S-box-containing protein
LTKRGGVERTDDHSDPAHGSRRGGRRSPRPSDASDHPLAEPRGGLLSAALASITNAVVITDRHGTVEWVNAAFTRMSGYSAAEALGANPRLWKSGLQDREFYARLWETVLAGQTWQGEVVNRRKTGEHYVVHQSITPIVEPTGEVTHFVAIHEDVTDLHRTESERDLQTQQVAATSAAIAALTRDGTIASWNPAAESLTGWSSDEALGRSILELGIVPERTAGPTQVLRHLRTAGRSTGEATLARRDGTHVPVLLTTAPYVDRQGRVAGAIVVATDVTDLTHARAQAQARAASQLAVGRLARTALDELDLDALFDDAINLLAERLDVPLVKVLEHNRDALVVRAGLGWRDGVVGNARVPLGQDSHAGLALASREAVVLADASAERRFTVSDLLVTHGAVSGVTTTIRGWTRDYGVLSVHTREPRTFSHDEIALVDAVAALLGSAIARSELEQQLRQSAAELVRADAIRSAFLRATSHELRTPLTVVAAIAETLARRGDEIGSEQRGLLLERQRVNAERLSCLIEDLLDVDRLEAGIVEPHRAEHALHEVVEQIAVEQELGGRRLELDLDPVVAHVDRPKVERIVANLLANAVRHTPQDTTISVVLRAHGEVVQLIVEDDGPGIDPEVRERIFEPFVQGPESASHPSPGTGLGLTLVRELAELHGGRAHVTDRPGGGTRFEVALPLGE